MNNQIDQTKLVVDHQLLERIGRFAGKGYLVMVGTSIGGQYTVAVGGYRAKGTSFREALIEAMRQAENNEVVANG